MKRILLASSLILACPTHASIVQPMGGNEVGNGGDVVVCGSKKKLSSIQLLDFFESKEKDKKEISSTLKSETEIIQTIVTRIKVVDPKRGELFERKSKAFLDEVDFINDTKLSDIPDSFHIVLPRDKSCRLEQIAILNKGQLTGQKKFVVDKQLWDRLDALNKAGLVMHELIYEYFSSLGEKNSIKARAYNAFVFGTFTKDDYWKFTKNLRLSFYR